MENQSELSVSSKCIKKVKYLTIRFGKKGGGCINLSSGRRRTSHQIIRAQRLTPIIIRGLLGEIFSERTDNVMSRQIFQ